MRSTSSSRPSQRGAAARGQWRESWEAIERARAVADVSWDAIWERGVMVDDGGWSVEIRIPYSQLRFQERPEHVWGVNFRRDISRNNESAWLVFTPKNGSGFVANLRLRDRSGRRRDDRQRAGFRGRLPTDGDGRVGWDAAAASVLKVYALADQRRRA